MERCLGKTALMLELAEKYNKNIITRYGYFYKPYIYENSYKIQNECMKIRAGRRVGRDIVFFVDGMSRETADTLLKNGYILIGYID